MTVAEAWQQCSARGTMVTRLAYIVGFTPLLLEGRTDRSTEEEKEIERKRKEPRKPRKHLGSSSECLLPPV